MARAWRAWELLKRIWGGVWHGTLKRKIKEKEKVNQSLGHVILAQAIQIFEVNGNKIPKKNIPKRYN